MNNTNKVTEKAKIAQARGIEYVASITKSHYRTEYYHVVSVAKIIAAGKWLPPQTMVVGNCKVRGTVTRAQLPDNTIRYTEFMRLSESV